MALRGRQVFQGRASRYARQQAAQGMAHCELVQVACPPWLAQVITINAIIRFGGLGEGVTVLRQVVALGQEMGQGETQVEGGIAKMNDLVVEQDELAGGDEHVLGAVIPVNERQLAKA